MTRWLKKNNKPEIGASMGFLFFRLLAFMAVWSSLSAAEPNTYLFRGVEMRDIEPRNVAVNWKNQKVPLVVRYVSLPLREYERVVKDKKTILVGKVYLERSITISFYENPRDTIGYYNSTVVISRNGHALHRYNIGDIFKSQALSLGYIGIVRSEDDEPLLICNYVGQPSENLEGFVIIRLQSSEPSFYALPLTNYGKAVISSKNLDQVELWSASSSDIAGANAMTRYYSQLCQLQDGRYQCDASVLQQELFAPNALINPAIEFRP